MNKKTIGIFLIIVGILALVTPFTPGSWLIFVGLEFIGIRIVFWDKIRSWFSAKGPLRRSDSEASETSPLRSGQKHDSRQTK